jgi:hypothetical protein
VRRAAIVAALLLMAMDSADACHRYQRWYYPYPQNCRMTALAPKSRFRLPRARIDISLKMPARPVVPLPPDIPLPDLANIEWGQFPDDELRGRLLLRVLLQGKDNK